MGQRIFKDRIVSFKEKGIYIAVSLNFYIVAEADDLDTAIERLKDATLGYLEVCLEDNESDELIYRPAPEEYQDMWVDVHEINKFVPPKTQKGILKKKETNILKKEVRTRTEVYAA